MSARKHHRIFYLSVQNEGKKVSTNTPQARIQVNMLNIFLPVRAKGMHI